MTVATVGRVASQIAVAVYHTAADHDGRNGWEGGVADHPGGFQTPGVDH